MKKVILAFVAAAFVSPAFVSTAFAADQENTGSTTVDHSKNPITGTETTTKKTKIKKKGPKGKTEKTVKDTTSVKKNGEVEKTEKVDSDTTTKETTKE